MEYAAINSPEAALVAGLVTSLHCAGMCGPLACVLLPTAGPSADASIIASTYHSTRLASYTLLGALAGGLGRFPLNALPGAILRGIPWLLVVFFVALALRWDRYLPKSLALQRFTWRFVNRLKRRSALASAAGLGLATPLLPCGPLYFLITLSGFTGSALRGAEFMLAFGLGTLPLLWLAQSRFQSLRHRLSPSWLNGTRLALALGSALLISWRLRGSFGGPAAGLVCF